MGLYLQEQLPWKLIRLHNFLWVVRFWVIFSFFVHLSVAEILIICMNHLNETVSHYYYFLNKIGSEVLSDELMFRKISGRIEEARAKTLREEYTEHIWETSRKLLYSGFDKVQSNKKWDYMVYCKSIKTTGFYSEWDGNQLKIL